MASAEELKDIANLMRRDVIKMTTEAGSGHPTSCMSCAEIFSVLFFEEMNYEPEDASNPNNDNFVLSKGHSAPIWYSALDRAGCIDEELTSLRDLDSHLQGHPMPMSLDWIEVATGSLGQGLSIAVGEALAEKKHGRETHTFTVLGDSESAEGQVYEALQLGSYYDLDNLTAIIDVNRLGQRGETMVGHNVDWYRDRFQSFGWDVEVVDGHSVPELKGAFFESRRSDRPTVIVAKTVKGKGYSKIENEDGWHGKPLSSNQMEEALEEIPDPDMPNTEISNPKSSGKDLYEKNDPNWTEYRKGQHLATRDAYGNAIANLADADEKVLAVDAEVSNSTRSEYVKENNPEQFVESFIAEQNMISMAQGLSVKGFNVFASTFSAFISRAHDQIRMAALSESDLAVVGSHAGVSIGEDGASQMGLSDISLFRALRDSEVFYPSDAVSTQKMVENIYETDGIRYLRTTRPETPVIYDQDEEFPIGEFKIVEQPDDPDVVLAGAGITVHEALKAKNLLEKEGIEASVIDIYCVKPFNEDKLAEYLQHNGEKMVVSEDHYPEGGIGEMIRDHLEGTGYDIRTLAVEQIPHSGEKQELLHKCGIGRHGIKEAAEELID